MMLFVLLKTSSREVIAIGGVRTAQEPKPWTTALVISGGKAHNFATFGSKNQSIFKNCVKLWQICFTFQKKFFGYVFHTASIKVFAAVV